MREPAMSGKLIYPGSSGDNRPANGRRGSPKLTPLTRFVDAKQKINAIFTDIQSYVDGLAKMMLDLAEQHTDMISSENQLSTCRCQQSVKTIRDMLARDHMKVVFFGRTSNGKSTVVNAMLHTKALPSGIGHTTCCFVQVEGSEKGDKYFTVDGSDEPHGIESLDDVASALAKFGKDDNMGVDTIVRMYWPKADSKLLRNDVVLVDTPGVDVTPEFDSWIDKHCLDADVFVFVANAEATLTQAEKAFFFRVRDKVSKPNIFILNNRWDASAAEPDQVEQVRQQHMTQFTGLLVNDLHVCSQEEARDRIYFVSAREVLTQRLRDKGINTPSSFIAEGHMERAMQFADFEKEFELTISQSAILTKFVAHLRRGRDLIAQLHQITDNVYRDADAKRQQAHQVHKCKLDELRTSQSHLAQLLNKYKDCIQHDLSHEVQLKVANDFSEEIRRLDYIIQDFTRPFTDDTQYLETYKKQLVDFIDGTITQRLVERCTGGLHSRIVAVERDMIAGVSALLPSEYAGKASEVMNYRDPFKFSITINCHVLMEDFQEDLEFRFSLGLTNVIRRVYAFSRQRQVQTTVRPQRSISDKGDGASGVEEMLSLDENLMKTVVLSSATYVANGGVGLLVLSGLVYKSVGLKPIMVVGALYGGLYAYERLRWNMSAKEHLFKKQVRQHLSWKLRTLANTYTASCDGQVTRWVQEVLGRLHANAADCHQKMKVDVDKCAKNMAMLDKITKDLASTKGTNSFIRSELDGFESKYLVIPE